MQWSVRICCTAGERGAHQRALSGSDLRNLHDILALDDRRFGSIQSSDKERGRGEEESEDEAERWEQHGAAIELQELRE